MATKLSHEGVSAGDAFKGDYGDYGPEKSENRKGTYNTKPVHGARSGTHEKGVSSGDAFQGDRGNYGPELVGNRSGTYNDGHLRSDNGIAYGTRSGVHKGGVSAGDAFKGDRGKYGPELVGNRSGTYNDGHLKKDGSGPAYGTRGGVHQETTIIDGTKYGTSTVLTDRPMAPTSVDLSNKEPNGGWLNNLSQGEGWAPTSNLVFSEDDWKLIRQRDMKIYGRDLNIFNNIYRFGYLNPSDAISNTREYLFFTKPELYIYEPGKSSKVLRPELADIPFWREMYNYHNKVLFLLSGEDYLRIGGTKLSRNNNLLSNQVSSTLDVPGTDAVMSETGANKYGVSISYRGSSEASDDNFDFSLEFKDTRNLDVYHFFKAYEEYETLKHHGVIGPPMKYIEQKILHDQFAIYKFIVDEDMETIVYYCKYYGVTPKSLPRDIFSSNTFENGIVYSIGFHAQFFEDMDPRILYDFNTWMGTSPYLFWKTNMGGVPMQKLKKELTGTLHPVDEDGEYDYRGARAAYVMRGNMDNKYKLLWI